MALSNAAKLPCGWDWAREWGRTGVAPKGGELMDFASCGEVNVGLVGLEGARERLGVRDELGGEETDCTQEPPSGQQ